ncbi:MAG: hypothetical protein ACK551_05730 [Vampirovibrionales bacterium]
MGLSINPFYQSASVPANTTADQARTTNEVIQNQNELRLGGVKQASVVIDPDGKVVSTFNA